MRVRFWVVRDSPWLAAHAADLTARSQGTQQETCVPPWRPGTDVERAADGSGAVIHDMQAHALCLASGSRRGGPLRRPSTLSSSTPARARSRMEMLRARLCLTALLTASWAIR